MIKKILTTKAHLLVLFLGVINVVIPQLTFWGTYDLNRTIGWGWDISKYIWYYDWYLNFVWVIIFPISYWVFQKNNYVFYFPIILLQAIVIVLLIFSRSVSPELRYYVEFANWVLFFINIFTASAKK